MERQVYAYSNVYRGMSSGARNPSVTHPVSYSQSGNTTGTPSNPLWPCLQVRSFESSNREIGFGATGYVRMALKGSE